VQTAKACGLPANAATDLIAELDDTAIAGVERARAALPKDFPETIASSIADGAKQRLKALAMVDGRQ
jgi:serine/threonine-protein kinase HipA